MRRILALDTSSNACSVALAYDDVRFCRAAITPRGHMQRLLPMVDEVLAEAGVKVSSLDAIAFGRGPGSFTGLRVATGVVQGLAYGADLPVIPVSSLASLAQGYSRLHPAFAGSLAVAVDARMGEIYGARFTVTGQEIAASSDELLAPVADWPACLTGTEAACGSGWLLAPELPPVCTTEIEPDAQDVLTLAATGQITPVAADQALPIYLRDSVSWQKRTRIRTQSL
ncbi:tRNA (adenosine(37)-N6)-threonylcarbamoyltransferase complex dimerization subunit type 1 TsaB [Simiduia sp. 21SJ11W-1]|uniref:tRNA (adenosine(37)-N6)-threonylcarbamoyltransferase complex dimerization subunit type 1 TsaB n=1 Tax=Simiduia sp. 21SJ11W-1 TaxID=2909669 RepID=UPI00209F741B|nr:tRNA (adenosine(37)-N6)-threonylcarbamoyltransferase complex dimerization subunit type 1 TsaB [Simiduia sp. 21SJ11W-1]UTA49416.1 tRNA (adenosine(37)-N6)-threonylcarbamoyltransferase complex dimerization subunit type 1 TsaB [Simiduia sp. 21SJ11W-1]